jgi:hypothetical protein
MHPKRILTKLFPIIKTKKIPKEINRLPRKRYVIFAGNPEIRTVIAERTWWIGKYW